MQLNYAQMEKERGRMALVRDARPPVPPVPRGLPDGPARRPAPARRAARAPPGADHRGHRQEQLEAGPGIRDRQLGETVDAPVAASSRPPPRNEFADAEVYKGFKKMRKKLGKKVLPGKMTVDEARARLGRQFAQKAAEPERAGRAAPRPRTA